MKRTYIQYSFYVCFYSIKIRFANIDTNFKIVIVNN